MTARTLSSQAIEARAELRRLLPVGSQVTTALLHVSRSGMSRTILPTIGNADGSVTDLTWLVVRADLGFTPDRNRGGFNVSGCGMDMGFHLVYSLSRALYADGHKCTGHARTETRRNGRIVRGCPSNDHANDGGELVRQWDGAHPDAAALIEANVYGWRRVAPDTDDETRAAVESALTERAEWIAAQPMYRRTRTHRDGGYAISQRWIA